jgi:hypothetical protein
MEGDPLEGEEEEEGGAAIATIGTGNANSGDEYVLARDEWLSASICGRSVVDAVVDAGAVTDK